MSIVPLKPNPKPQFANELWLNWFNTLKPESGKVMSIQSSLLRSLLGRDRRANRNLSKPKARLDGEPHLCDE